jgi:transketolase
MAVITRIPRDEFARVLAAELPRHARLALLADMCRANTLAAVKRAGSGHLGSSFSAMDIVVALYFAEMNTARVGFDDPNRDIYFSSKGHDVPGLYSVLDALGVLPEDQLMRLRRLGGLCGHPDVATPGLEANTGSLGMGIAKGKGFVFAKRLQGHGGRVFVMTGDGELQEGQIYESLLSAVNQDMANLHVIVDHNKVQSDMLVERISGLGDVEAKFAAFGWHVQRCNGHDLGALERAFAAWREVTDRPKVLIADTIKGRGVSFMEHPAALDAGCGFYKYHSGAPDDAAFAAGHGEIVARVNAALAAHGLGPVALEEVAPEQKVPAAVSLQGEPDSRGAAVAPVTKAGAEFVADAYGAALVEIGRRRPDLVVLDADLSADCRLRGFEQQIPERFIQNGIAEQDMVSMAGGLALSGLLPVVNTFGSFLAARANEQIYNNACEKTRIVYVSHYAGLIPAGPGQSHQSIRDISLFGALPNCEILQPCNGAETEQVLAYCVDEAPENTMIRLIIGPSPRRIELPAGYRLTHGRGVALTEGADALLFAYGPVMLHEALTAAELLAADGFGLRVVNLPWLNRFDAGWLAEVTTGFGEVWVLEDHAPVGGLGDRLREALGGGERPLPVRVLGVEGMPAWGTPPEVLRHHGLSGPELARRIRAAGAAA